MNSHLGLKHFATKEQLTFFHFQVTQTIQSQVYLWLHSNTNSNLNPLESWKEWEGTKARVKQAEQGNVPAQGTITKNNYYAEMFCVVLKQAELHWPIRRTRNHFSKGGSQMLVSHLGLNRVCLSYIKRVRSTDRMWGNPSTQVVTAVSGSYTSLRCAVPSSGKLSECQVLWSGLWPSPKFIWSFNTSNSKWDCYLEKEVIKVKWG